MLCIPSFILYHSAAYHLETAMIKPKISGIFNQINSTEARIVCLRPLGVKGRVLTFRAI